VGWQDNSEKITVKIMQDKITFALMRTPHEADKAQKKRTGFFGRAKTREHGHPLLIAGRLSDTVKTRGQKQPLCSASRGGAA